MIKILKKKNFLPIRFLGSSGFTEEVNSIITLERMGSSKFSKRDWDAINWIN